MDAEGNPELGTESLDVSAGRVRSCSFTTPGVDLHGRIERLYLRFRKHLVQATSTAAACQK